MCTDTAMRRQRGLTLVEMLMFIVIVGIALAGILQMLAFTTRHSADPVRRKQALMIAEGLLEEVELASFTACDPRSATASPPCTVAEAFGPDAPTDTRPYDNVNDYVPAANTPTAAFDVNGKLSDAVGNPLDVNGYSALVIITPEPLGPAGADSIGALGNSADADVLRIRIEVRYDDETLVLDGYRTRYAPTIE
jgi:MSHA pilin protein MshD